MNEQEYLTLDEAADYIGIKRGSLPYQLKRLGIETQRFALSKHAYITREEANRVKLAREKPWTTKKDEQVA